MCVFYQTAWANEGSVSSSASASQTQVGQNKTDAKTQAVRYRFVNPLPHNRVVSKRKDGFDLETAGLLLSFGDRGLVSFGIDSEVGMWDDQGLYASFGCERQLFRFSKVVLTAQGFYRMQRSGHAFVFKVDFAPLYDSIKRDLKEEKIYGQDSAGRDIDGATLYRDWYKNLGSRLYYLGSIPLVEAYAGYQTKQHRVRIGRQKNLSGFEDDEMPWGDDGKFAPIGQWLCRELLTGATYLYRLHGLEAGVGVFSGGHPMKAGGDYLGGVQSPNMKANNTPTFEGRLRFYYDTLLPKAMNGFLFASFKDAKQGSTWDDAIGDGKRVSSCGAVGALFGWRFDHWILTQMRLWGQLTLYKGGLDDSSAQNNGDARFRVFKKKGFFIGGDLTLFEDVLLWGAFEKMDRYDSRLHAYLGSPATHALEKSKQTSVLCGVRYQFQPFAWVGCAYHRLQNPAPYASHVWDKRGDNRFKLTLSVCF